MKWMQGVSDQRNRVIENMNTFGHLRLSWRLFRDARVPGWKKLTVPAIALLYVISPIDLIPDFILGMGQIDDLSVIGIALFAMTKLLPKLANSDVIDDHLSKMGVVREQQSGLDQRPDYVDTSFRYTDQPAKDAR